MPSNGVFRSADALSSRRLFLTRSGQLLGATALAGTASSFLAACGSSSSGGGSAATATKMVVSIAAAPSSLDPIVSTSGSAPFYTLVNERLFSYSQDNKPVPMLATSYEVSDDLMNFTFHLREGVTFSNGSPFTSADVKFTLETMKDPANKATFTAQTYMTSIETPDDYTVTIVMERPSPFLEYNLGAFPIVSHEIPYNAETYASELIGTGPFLLSEWKAGQSLTFTKNPDYWMKDEPVLEEVTFEVTPDATARIAALVNGSAQVVPDISPQEAELLKKQDKVAYEVPLIKFYYMWLNWKTGPMSEPSMREAVAWAIDRGQIADNVFASFAEPESTYPCVGYEGYDETLGQTYGSEPDLEKVKAALEAAGGAPSEPLILLAPNDDPSVPKQATIIADNLEKAGIPVTIQVVTYAQAFASLQEGNFDLFVYPGNQVTSSSQIYNLLVAPANFTGIDDAELTELATSIYTGPVATHPGLVKELQERFLETNPMIMLVTLPTLWGISADVEDLNIPRNSDNYGFATAHLG